MGFSKVIFDRISFCIPYRKIKSGMAAYEKNTGVPHPLSGGIKTSNKRDKTGSVQLTDEDLKLWYGTISIGTPPQDFTGLTLSSG